MQNLRGIFLMVLAMAGFACGDVGIKMLSPVLSLGQIMLSIGIGGTAFFLFWSKLQGVPVWSRDILSRTVCIRFVAEIAAALLMVYALALIPLSLLTAILQAAPLVVVAGGTLIFGEPVGWRRWMAIAVGLLGVLLILRPGTDSFDPHFLLAVGTLIALSVRDLATRAAPKSLSNLQLATVGFFALIVAGLLLVPFTGPFSAPTPTEWGWLIFAMLTTVGGYYAITGAMRIGEIAVVSPFRYSRLIFGLVFGVVLFGERPDAMTLIGAAIVLLAGVYTFWREQRRARERT